MRAFCTLFDKNYLYQGIALYKSLVRHAGDFELYALCMDAVSFSMLSKMNLANLIPLAIEDLLTPELVEVQRRTTHGQFCWVCQPIVCKHVLDTCQADMVTYLESDSLFFSSPEPLFEELGNRSVSLVPHNFSSNFDNSATAGNFCVQFNAFRNNHFGREVLEYWKVCCFEYHLNKPNVYPGQTNLDNWPSRFNSVAVIEHRGAGVAPWNIGGYELTMNTAGPHVNGVPVVFFHYHQYGRLKSGAYDLGSYPLTKNVIESLYRPYVTELKEAEDTVRTIDPTFSYRREYSDTPNFRQLAGSFSIADCRSYWVSIRRKLRGRNNIFPSDYF